MKLERSGGLDYLVGGERQCVFPALLTPGSVDAGYCRVDNVDIEHLRGPHWKIANGIQWVGILVGCAAQRNTFRFCQSVDEQTQRDDQGCDDRHAVAVVESSWAQSTTG